MSEESRIESLIESLFALSPVVRYAAVYLRGELFTASREGTAGASSSESDKYEELLVNPTLLTLARQRGNIDCGGLEYVLVRYGNFFQLVTPLEGGHLSVCIEPHSDPLHLLEPVGEAVHQTGLR